jgi:hypothetical protein
MILEHEVPFAGGPIKLAAWEFLSADPPKATSCVPGALPPSSGVRPLRGMRRRGAMSSVTMCVGGRAAGLFEVV